MADSTDYLHQLLQGGLLGNSGGLTGGLMNSSDGLLGLSLLANSNTPGGFGSIFGRSALQANEIQQQNAGAKMDLIQKALGLGMTQQKLSALAPFMGGAAQQAQSPMQQPVGSQVPRGTPDGQSQTFQQPTQFAGAQDFSNLPIAGIHPEAYRRLAIANGKDPLDTEKEIRAIQLQTYQQSVAPQVSAIDTIRKSDKPSAYVAASPQLRQIWAQTAPALGFDPVKDFNDQNVRTALDVRRNQIASAAQLPSEAPNAPLKTIKLPDGRTAQIDPVSGKINIESASPLVKVVGKDGKPVYVPEAQAAGMRPYNEMTAASDDALQATADDVAHYKLAPPSGSKLLSGNWPQVMQLVKSINPDYDGTQFATKNKARQMFATGKQGDIVRSLSVATDHLDQLSRAVDEMKNGGIPAANKIANFFSQQTGNPAVNNFNAMKEIVGDEVVKAVVGATGASADREAIKKTFSDANSPQQLAGVIAKYKGLMGGQLKGLRQQYQRTTGLKDFDQAISDTAQSELGGSSGSHPTDIQALLSKYRG